jgi:hypothetical protein
MEGQPGFMWGQPPSAVRRAQPGPVMRIRVCLQACQRAKRWTPLSRWRLTTPLTLA